ncbi:hypothetical protein FQN49_003779 [Arthroderma sp. PD_2]|nr:hypothetical protein FQN49_003779 [Arthroderma sp. PD_2]
MAAHHRHQASLECVLDFSAQTPLSSEELALASLTFRKLLDHCEPVQGGKPYKKATLVRLMYEHSRIKDVFLQQLFVYLGSHSSLPGFTGGLKRFSGFDPESPSDQKEAEGAVDGFADYLFNNFFLPMKASGLRTPQPTPAALSAPALENAVGTPSRLSTLRRDCLIRDHYRCVATRSFDITEAYNRHKRDGANSKDDEGEPLIQSKDSLAVLEVAHIIPHSLMSADDRQQLSDSKKSALAILDMFDPGVIHEIEGPNIDRPTNAITLTSHVHYLFGNFMIHFTSMDPVDYPPHTYRIGSAETDNPFSPSWLPVTRTLHLSLNRTIDPPSRRLLGIHRSCAVILHLSAAGDHADQILRDMEEPCVPSDGSAHLGHLVSLKLNGWFDGVAV